MNRIFEIGSKFELYRTQTNLKSIQINKIEVCNSKFTAFNNYISVCRYACLFIPANLQIDWDDFDGEMNAIWSDLI